MMLYHRKRSRPVPYLVNCFVHFQSFLINPLSKYWAVTPADVTLLGVGGTELFRQRRSARYPATPFAFGLLPAEAYSYAVCEKDTKGSAGVLESVRFHHQDCK
jgi:hypothetical protein